MSHNISHTHLHRNHKNIVFISSVLMLKCQSGKKSLRAWENGVRSVQKYFQKHWNCQITWQLCFSAVAVLWEELGSKSAALETTQDQITSGVRGSVVLQLMLLTNLSHICSGTLATAKLFLCHISIIKIPVQENFKTIFTSKILFNG